MTDVVEFRRQIFLGQSTLGTYANPYTTPAPPPIFQEILPYVYRAFMPLSPRGPTAILGYLYRAFPNLLPRDPR
jgi:hypothetical protein